MTTIWEPLSATPLLPEEEATLDQLLAATLKDSDTNVGAAVGFSDQHRSSTTHVYTVSILAPEGLVLGSVYEHPGRTAVAVRRVAGGASAAVDPDAEFEQMLEALKKPAE